LLTERAGEPNGAYWLYTWYADMSGQMVTTTPPSNESPLDGAASVSDAQDEVQVITGGNSGPTTVRVEGLDALNLGEAVNVELQMTPSYGRTTPTAGPITISTTTYEVGDDGAVEVPIVMNTAYGYRVLVTPAGDAPDLAGTFRLDNVNSGLALDVVDGQVVQSDVTAHEVSTWQ